MGVGAEALRGLGLTEGRSSSGEEVGKAFGLECCYTEASSTRIEHLHSVCPPLC